MADEKNKVTDKASEIAKNIWLAGVGAYGRAVDEAQGRLEKAGMEPPKLFRDLVKAGAALEEEARDAIEAGNAARNSVEERISRVRENFSLQRPVRGEDLLALHEKLDRISARLDALAAIVEGGSKTTARKKAPAKRSGSTSRKAATKAAPASKKTSAAKAGTAKKPASGTRTRVKTRTSRS